MWGGLTVNQDVVGSIPTYGANLNNGGSDGSRRTLAMFLSTRIRFPGPPPEKSCTAISAYGTIRISTIRRMVMTYVAKMVPTTYYGRMPQCDMYIKRGSATKWAERWWVGVQPFSNLTKARLVVLDNLDKLKTYDETSLYNIVECEPMSQYIRSNPESNPPQYADVDVQSLQIAADYDYTWVNKYVAVVRALYYKLGAMVKKICKLSWFKSW